VLYAFLDENFKRCFRQRGLWAEGAVGGFGSGAGS